MSQTLLELVQTVLSSVDGDEVNSISDTVEATQAARIVRTCFREIMSRTDLPEHFSMVNLDASGDDTKPTLMTLPENVAELMWLKYNKETTDDTDMNFQPVTFKPKAEFLEMMWGLNESDDNVGTFSHTVNGFSTTYLYVNDKAPDYYTNIDDHTLIFDSYDSDVDNTLQSSKTSGYAHLTIPFTLSDGFVIPLDDNQMFLLESSAKALAWAELKQTIHQSAERSASRGWTSLQKTKHRTEKQSFFDTLPNYGRKRR